MEANLELGLSMLLVGMITVFFILFFVVAGGSILIRISNKFFAPAATTEVKMGTSLGSKKMAAIIAAVEVVSGGEGKISSIKKIR